MRLIVILLIVGSILFSATVKKANADRSGRTTKELYYNNGSKKVILKYLSGTLDGVSTYYYRNGDEAKTVNYKGGRKDGLSVNYYENGSIKRISTYINGLLVKDKAIYFNGEVKYDIDKDYLVLGKITDIVFKQYNDDGSLMSKAYYNKNGLINGLKMTFYGKKYDKKTYSAVTYVNGRREGLAEYYNRYNGGVSYRIYYKNDKLDGSYRSYYSNGNPNIITHYYNGFENGKFVQHYINNNLRIVTYYKNGHKNGKYGFYNVGGKLIYETYYKNGKKDGLTRSYYDDGSIKEKKFYVNDRLNGSYIKYANNGNLVFAKKYSNGVLVYSRNYNKNGKMSHYIVYDSLGHVLTSRKYEYYSDGFKKSIKTYNKNDRRQGYFLNFNSTGRLNKVVYYENGELVFLNSYSDGVMTRHVVYNEVLYSRVLKKYGRFDPDKVQ